MEAGCYKCQWRIHPCVKKENVPEFQFLVKGKFKRIIKGEKAPKNGIYYFVINENSELDTSFLPEGEITTREYFFAEEDGSFQISDDIPTGHLRECYFSSNNLETSKVHLPDSPFIEEDGKISIPPRKFNMRIINFISTFSIFSFLLKKKEEMKKVLKDNTSRYACLCKYELEMSKVRIKEEYFHFTNYYKVLLKDYFKLVEEPSFFFKVMDFCHASAMIDMCEYFYDVLQHILSLSDSLLPLKEFSKEIISLEEKLKLMKLKTDDEVCRYRIYRGMIDRAKDILMVSFEKMSLYANTETYVKRENLYLNGASRIRSIFDYFGDDLEILKCFWTEDVIKNKFYGLMSESEKKAFIKEYGTMPSLDDFKKLEQRKKKEKDCVFDALNPVHFHLLSLKDQGEILDRVKYFEVEVPRFGPCFQSGVWRSTEEERFLSYASNLLYRPRIFLYYKYLTPERLSLIESLRSSVHRIEQSYIRKNV